jgi:ribosomal protein RSM22 (predicted rRNA methylase)
MDNGTKILARDVVRLSKLLTSERGSLPQAYLKDAGLRAAYVSYFLPSNLKKMHMPLMELSRHPAGILTASSLRILDIGSGPGTALFGMLEFFGRLAKQPDLDFTAVDLVQENLKEIELQLAARREKVTSRVTLKTIRSSVEKLDNLPGDRFDMILLSNVLNELFADNEEKIIKRAELLTGILGRFLTDSGTCIIIEPALRETSREMLEVRDELLERSIHVFSPCLCRAKCPALKNPRDWCHEDIPWDPPVLIREIDRLAGLRKDSLKFCYLVLRKDSVALSDTCGNGAFRVVSEPLVTKGKIEFFVCGSDGRRRITRFDKDRSAINQSFEKMRRGTVVRFDRLLDEGKRLNVGRATAVMPLQQEGR